MRSRMIVPVMLIGAALAATVVEPALAAPPLMSDDVRVGAPAVIVARPIAPPIVAVPIAARPVPPMPPKPVTPALSAALKQPAPVAISPPRAVVQPPLQVASPASPQPRAQVAHSGPAPIDAGYHRPDYGYQIPAEWTAPDYYISDTDSYDLPRAASGFGWSRYYDDAVLTDQWGRVYDSRDDVNWADHDAGYSGRDHRRAHEKPRARKYANRGRWVGSWNGGAVQSYQGEWHGSDRPHWRGGYEGGYRGASYGSSYGAYYDGGGTTVTTVVIQAAAPVMQTRTISYDEVSYVPVRKKIVRRYKPRPKPVCACGS